MALINCPECNSEISNTVKKCPKCGYKFKKTSKKVVILPIILAIVVAVIVGVYFAVFNLSGTQKSQVKEYNDKIKAVMEVDYSQKEKSYLKTELKNVEKLQSEVDSLDFKVKMNLDEKNGAKKTVDLINDSIAKKENEEVKAVEDAINEIGKVTVDSSSSIENAEKLYDNLEDELKSKVKNYSTLTSGREECDNLMIANAIELIDKIGKVSLKDGDKKIREASKAYNALSTEAKEKVTNSDKLKDASEKYNTLDRERNEKENIKKAKNSIKITKKYFDMNSVGGCDVYIFGTNTSGKTINYITFTVSYYNAVGDQLSDDISHDRTKNLQETGPIAPGGSFGNGKYWSTAWYNTTTKKFQIDSVEIDYDDGTSQTISGQYMKYIE